MKRLSLYVQEIEKYRRRDCEVSNVRWESTAEGRSVVHSRCEESRMKEPGAPGKITRQ